MSSQNYNGQMIPMKTQDGQQLTQFSQSMEQKGGSTMPGTTGMRSIEHSQHNIIGGIPQVQTMDNIVFDDQQVGFQRKRSTGRRKGSKSAVREKRYSKGMTTKNSIDPSNVYGESTQGGSGPYRNTMGSFNAMPRMMDASFISNQRRSSNPSGEGHGTPQRHRANSNLSSLSKKKRSKQVANTTTNSWLQETMQSRPQYHQKTRSNMMPGQSHRKPSLSSMDRNDRQSKRGALSVSVKGSFSRPRGSLSTKQIIPMYVNVTGPGDYDVPGFADRPFGEAESHKRTAPAFTLAPKTKQPYWPGYEVDFKGKDSPGMTLYNPKFQPVVEQNPVFSLSKGNRFEGIEYRNRNMLSVVPNQYHDQSLFDDKHGFSMSTGKKWTLKMSKEDQTTPGPVYETQYLNSFQSKVDRTDELKNGTFGAFRDRQRTIPNKGFENAYLGTASPGPQMYQGLETAKVKAALSVTRHSQKYSMGKEERFQRKKVQGPSPAQYQNTNEVSDKVILKKRGAFSMPKQQRKFDFAKFSSLHSSLVSKGYY